MAYRLDLESFYESERQLVAAEINEEEDFSTRLIRSTTDGILAYDRNFRYTIWNPAMERLTGFSRNSVMGRNAFDVFPFLKETGIDRLFHAALEGETSVLNNVPYKISPTGKEGFLQTRHSPLYDEEGKIVGGLAVVNDITLYKRALEEIQVLNKELEQRVEDRTAELRTTIAQLENEVRERRRAEKRFQFIAEAGAILSDSLDYATVIDNAVKLASQHFDGGCHFRIVNQDGSAENIVHHLEPAKAEILRRMHDEYPIEAFSDSGPMWVFENRKPEWYPDLRDETLVNYAKDETHLAYLRALGLRSYFCIPLFVRDRLLGSISFFSNMRAYTQDDIRVAEVLARRMSVAIDNARLFTLAQKRA